MVVPATESAEGPLRRPAWDMPVLLGLISMESLVIIYLDVLDRRTQVAMTARLDLPTQACPADGDFGDTNPLRGFSFGRDPATPPFALRTLTSGLSHGCRYSPLAKGKGCHGIYHA